MRILVTGSAGFIGLHVSRALLDRDDEVVGLDNMNSYYDTALKEARLAQLIGRERFTFVRGDLTDSRSLARAFNPPPHRVIHLAAQPGVRYSITNPHAYIDSNVIGTLNVLEACRQRGTEHLVYASSSSVYGANSRLPFSEHDSVDHPVSLYAATKKASELMAHTYSHLYGLATTGLRFFTVYGPWGRPDMAPSLFAKAIFDGTPLNLFNDGRMSRDFTYIDDIVDGVLRVLDKIPEGNADWSASSPDPASSKAPYRLYNIGNGQAIDLVAFVHTLERVSGRNAELTLSPMQPGDVHATCADIDELKRDVGFCPKTDISEGLELFISWYRSYYGH